MGELIEQVLRLAHYALLLGLFGWTTFGLVGLRGQSWAPLDRGGHTLSIAAFAAPVVSLALMLASIAAMMGEPIAALNWPMVEAMMAGTDIGKAFLVRAALLVIGLCALLGRYRGAVGFPIASACFAGALITLGWSGHAAATEGAFGIFHRLNNGVHLLAAGLWLGAIGWFLRLTVAAHSKRNNIPAQPLLAAMHGFAPLGVGLVVTVAFTGLINSQLTFGLENSGTVLTTSYGILLAAKVILVGGLLAFGAHNARISRRNALTEDDEIADTAIKLSGLRRSLMSEFVLAISVIVLVAVLGTMSPMIV
jgi:putative copper resistance protein D